MNMMKRLRQYPLLREILIILAVKFALIVAIKLAFFSDPVRPGSEGTARMLLSAPDFNTTPEWSSSHD